jgi:thiol-disulfide isomerase/thioredoxin
MNTMRTRWIVAGVSALALALLTLAVPLEWPFHGPEDGVERAGGAGPGDAASGETCPADAKAANLNYTLKDANDHEVRLADFKGKVILLDFWATWCGPCKVEIPWFVEFQEKYGSDGLQVIGVSVDDTRDKLTPFVSQFKMNYIVLQGLGHDDLQEEYGPLWGIPVTMLISREGKICLRHTGMGTKEDFESAIKSLL